MADRNDDYSAMKESLHALGHAVEELKTYNDEALEKKASGESVSELELKLERVDEEVDKLEQKAKKIERSWEADRARIEELEKLQITGGTIGNKKVLDEHVEAFCRFLASGRRGSQALERLYEVEKKYISMLPQHKQVNLASDAAGAVLVPEIISSSIESMELELSPIRRLISAVTVTSTDFKQVVDQRGLTSGWIAETGTRSVTATPVLRTRTPTWGELYSRPQASDWASMDVPGLMQWLTESVVEGFIQTEGQAVISGNGSSRPTGLLNSAPVATADWNSPLRDADTLEKVSRPSPDSLVDHLIALQYALNPRYTPGASYVLNSLTLSAVRRAKDSNGQYLWQPSLITGEPATIAGFPFERWEDMNNLGTSPETYPVMFGNFRRGYLLAERSGIRVLEDPYTTIGLISWWFRRREAGIILNNDAIKVMQR